MSAICALPLVFIAANATAAAPLDPLTDACNLAYQESTKPLEPVVWTGHNGSRVVLLGLKGDRFECLFGDDGKAVPKLLSVETTSPDKSVTVLTGKTLGKLNGLIERQFSVLSNTSSMTAKD